MIEKFTWFSRPGTASTLIAKLGIVQAWMTSLDETKLRIELLQGTTRRLSTSRSRN